MTPEKRNEAGVPTPTNFQSIWTKVVLPTTKLPKEDKTDTKPPYVFYVHRDCR